MLLLVILLTLGSMAGCGGHTGDRDESADAETRFSGSVQISGSSSMEKLVNLLAEGFMEKYPKVRVSVQFTGSGAGIQALTEGSVDIGISSRYLEEGEKAAGAVENVIGLDGIAVCVDRENSVVELTMEQLTDIYRGSLRNWSQLGGEDVPIVVIGREAGSGTRSAFEKLLQLEGECAYGNELDSTGAVAARIAMTPGAIGYVSFDVMKHTASGGVTPLMLNGTEPAAENVRSGSYPLYRPFVMATRGKLSEQNLLVQLWFAYVYSEEGRKAAETVGLVPVSICSS
ncbi:MAG: phosphate ABC transporter substrate-binding protein [Lachnospiraceae bacterium]|nr:phosphate ABC transporter substrate-binding protein [Lachnospiraceae bacterium]